MAYHVLNGAIGKKKFFTLIQIHFSTTHKDTTV